MATYPAAIKTWVARTDNVDNVMADDVNSAYLEVTAVQTELGTTPKGTSASVKERIAGVRSIAGATADAVRVNGDDLRIVAGGLFVGADADPNVGQIQVLSLSTGITPGIFRVDAASDDGMILQLQKRNESSANTKAWNFFINDNTGTMRLLPNNADGLFAIQNMASTMNSIFLDTANALVCINDFSNANMTTGLTVNQAANDDEIMALKSSDVAHGITTLTETDTFGTVKKYNAGFGGTQIRGYTEGTVGASLEAVYTTDDTTKSTAGVGGVMINVYKKSGTTGGAVGADANLLAVTNNLTTRFILDGDGDSHQDVGTAWTNFDEFDDIALLTALSAGVSRPGDPLKEAFRGLLEAHRGTLEAARLVTFNEDGHHFVNWSRLNMVLIGAVRQLSARLEIAERKLSLLPEGN